ncbi:50S ribosomal protein L7ae-like protein [Alkalibaculum sp. M08DMB]|uniref:50S ribosomal protein L7ae-like protein n=1 Tax=Alkalibaculum sporogenes TaxID=2655001 RepID=A0A6A7K7G5_9FIRM|nr:ribosomal L7Ae/L30e/S12e/Gadd45 family protein [Alkalibaculum sporogenes]MPW25033.1 50S ribosomal protein L7ae-like protein [Alkalibaculum sporogenes]
MLDQIRVVRNVVGTKQTLKMVKSGKAKIVYLANDVDHHIVVEVEKLCKQNEVPLVYVDNMDELGKACGIHRKTATAAIVND